jgi:hypothetical protein
MRRVCVDAGFLIGLCNKNDQYHKASTDYYRELFEVSGNKMVIPWPILYETVKTATLRNLYSMRLLESYWKQMDERELLEILSDCRYRNEVIQDCFNESQKPQNTRRHLSAADRVIRNILADESVNVHAFLTSNVGDFADVCRSYNRALLTLRVSKA